MGEKQAIEKTWVHSNGDAVIICGANCANVGVNFFTMMRCDNYGCVYMDDGWCNRDKCHSCTYRCIFDAKSIRTKQKKEKPAAVCSTQQCPHCGAYPIWIAVYDEDDGFYWTNITDTELELRGRSVSPDCWMCGNCGEAIS